MSSRSAAASNGLDGGVIVSAGMLACLGLVMVYSTTAPLAPERAAPPQLLRHGLALCAALAAAIFAWRVPLAVWRRLALPLWGASVVLLGLTLVFGIEVNGATRWIAIPGVPLRLQPAEFAKWTTLLAVAAVLARPRATDSSSALHRCTALTALPLGLLLLQPDLSNAVLLAALVWLLLFVGGVPLLRLALPAAVGSAGLAAYVALRPYALARWRGFLDPWQTASQEGFQLVQSFVAFGRGGALGVGLGDGRQKLFYLPEAHTDFILSGVAEELGLAGVLLVLSAFAAFAIAGTRIARGAHEHFSLLIAFAMTALIALPAATNAAVVMGLLPTTGFTLPLLSFGANSLVACGLAVGMLLHVAGPGARGANGRRRRGSRRS
jgi:cell division protein FtsW